MMKKAVTTARPKKAMTRIRPSIRSPTSLAKPMTRNLIAPCPSSPDAWALVSPAYSKRRRNLSSRVRENAW
ncbi:hypothetical protein D9M72_429100 [compost metagenome]